MSSPIQAHRSETLDLARNLAPNEVYEWLVEYGYFPESYVLPPCFRVLKRPTSRKAYFQVNGNGKFAPPAKDYVQVHYPKTEFTDRTFGVIHPEIHNDIAYHVSRNWKKIVDAMIPGDSQITSYSFPVPVNKRQPGRVGHLRSGRMIYEFIAMTDADLATVAYKYTHLVRTDIKNFYPSIYTHSIAWALHSKATIRKGGNRFDHKKFVGNRLDKLFQNANDGCTNGLPIGPVVSDIVAEMIASAVDRLLTKELKDKGVSFEGVRFKDDYRILVSSAEDAKKVIKMLQAALKEYNLELNDDKTTVTPLPDGLFRPWVSRYHLAYPAKLASFSWKQFRELYLAVHEIDREIPGTGVIDRFLSDICTPRGRLKVSVGRYNLEKVVSMLLMMGTLRVKAFPKVMAILEKLLRRKGMNGLKAPLVSHLESFLKALTQDEARNKYLISWVAYFLASNDLWKMLNVKPTLKDPITRSIINNRAQIFKDAKDFKLFEGIKQARKRVSLFKHLDVFNPPVH